MLKRLIYPHPNKCLSICLGLLSVLILSSCQNDQGGLSVQFFPETEAKVKNRKTYNHTIAGKTYLFSTQALFTLNNVVAFKTFPSVEDINEYGLLLKLDRFATSRLKLISTSRQINSILSVINGKIVDLLFVDKTVEDGLIVIWRNVNLSVVRELSLKIPYIGETKPQWKARLRDGKILDQIQKNKASENAKRNQN